MPFMWCTTSRVFVLSSLLCLPVVASAQESAAAAEPATERMIAPDPADSGIAITFLKDVGHDYRNFFSVENGVWLGVGGVAAYGVHQGDQAAYEHVQAGDAPNLPGGNVWGSSAAQIPLAVVVWAVGSALQNQNASTTGRDLLRAQVSVVTWTYGIKYIADRTRPNGDPRSFPSGHASTSFAAAMVLQEHYGWKLGVPAFAAAAYTSVSRVTDNYHWASDVAFGAVLGMVAGRTVTLHLRQTRVSVAPLKLPGGGAVMVSLLRKDN